MTKQQQQPEESSNQLPVDQEKANTYIGFVLRCLQQDPGSLSPEERLLAKKVVESNALMDKTRQDIRDMTNQINQAQQRLRSLEFSLENELGRRAGLVEILVESKFLSEEPAPAKPITRMTGPKSGKEAVSKSAGKVSSTKPNGKKTSKDLAKDNSAQAS